MARGRPRKQKPIPPPPRDVTKDDNSRKVLESVVGDITRLEDESESKKGEYMAWCKRQRELINGHLDRAANSGLSKKSIKAVLTTRTLEKKLERVRDKLADDDLEETFDQMRLALGDLADLPLGQSALKDKGGDALSGLGDDDERDLRPPHLKQSEADRITEENTKRLEQGISPLPN